MNFTLSIILAGILLAHLQTHLSEEVVGFNKKTLDAMNAFLDETTSSEDPKENMVELKKAFKKKNTKFGRIFSRQLALAMKVINALSEVEPGDCSPMSNKLFIDANSIIRHRLTSGYKPRSRLERVVLSYTLAHANGCQKYHVNEFEGLREEIRDALPPVLKRFVSSLFYEGQIEFEQSRYYIWTKTPNEDISEEIIEASEELGHENQERQRILDMCSNGIGEAEITSFLKKNFQKPCETFNSKYGRLLTQGEFDSWFLFQYGGQRRSDETAREFFEAAATSKICYMVMNEKFIVERAKNLVYFLTQRCSNTG